MRTMVGAGPRGGYNAKSGGRLDRRARAAVRRPPHRRRSRVLLQQGLRRRRRGHARRPSSPTSSTPTSSATTCATRARTRPSTSPSPTAPSSPTSARRDQHGAILSPRGQAASKTLYTNQWNLKRSRIGEVAAGKTIDRILVAYDNPDGPADFGGWIDDIDIGPAKRAAHAQPPVRLGRDDPRHELERQLLARQQHPGDRGPARLQLLDAGDQRGHAELALRVPAGQQRGQPADAAGVLAQPRAEPVDGRPPDVPGDAHRGTGTPDADRKARALAVPPRQRDGQAVLLRRPLRERHARPRSPPPTTRRSCASRSPAPRRA